MGAGDRVGLTGGEVGLGGKLVPPGEGGMNFASDVGGAASFHRGGLGDGLKVGEGELIAFACCGHLMTCRPGTGRIEGVGDIESGRERPLAAFVHEERDVLDVVVLVAGDDVEDHASKLFFDGGHREIEAADDGDCLFV